MNKYILGPSTCSKPKMGTSNTTTFFLVFCVLIFCVTRHGHASDIPFKAPLQNLPEIQLQRMVAESFKLKDHVDNMDKPTLIRNMLMALEKGQDQMIHAVKPQGLRWLRNKYRLQENLKSEGNLIIYLNPHSVLGSTIWFDYNIAS